MTETTGLMRGRPVGVEGLPTRLAHGARALAGESSVLAALEQLAAGNIAPTTWTGGRTAWYAAEGGAGGFPELSQWGAIKVKGQGVIDGKRGFQRRPPTYVPHPDYPIRRHFGFSPRGDPCLVDRSPKPLGGLVLSAASNEFEIFERLREHGCPAFVPLAVFEYADTEFAGSPLGVVLSGCPDVDPLRPNVILDVENIEAASPEAAYAQGVALAFGITPRGDHWAEQRLQLYAALAAAYGGLLREFAEAGCFRYSSESSNFYFSAVRGEILIVDVDTSRFLDRVAASEAPLQIVRDVMSGLFHLCCEPVQPEHIAFSPLDRLAAADPQLAFLRGFFPELNLSEDCCEELRTYVSVVASRILRERDSLVKGAAGQRRFRSLWLDTMLLYVGLTRLAFGLFEHSRLAETWPLPYGLAELDRRLEQFAGAEYLRRAKTFDAGEQR